jgi:hypothetical protein
LVRGISHVPAVRRVCIGEPAIGLKAGKPRGSAIIAEQLVCAECELGSSCPPEHNPMPEQAFRHLQI